MIAYIVAAAVIGAAIWILWRRISAFKRTGGRSACENCPYSGRCQGGCDGKGQDRID